MNRYDDIDVPPLDSSLPSSPSSPSSPPARFAPLTIVLILSLLHSIGVASIVTALIDLVTDDICYGDIQAAALLLSVLEALIAAMQFFFDPYWGHLSDRWGRKPLLLLSILEFGGESLILALYPSWWSLVIMSAARGVLGVGFTFAGILMMDLSGAHPVLGPRFMGYFGAASGVGFVFGAAAGVISGQLGGVRAPFMVSAVVEFINAAFIIMYLPSERMRPIDDVDTTAKEDNDHDNIDERIDGHNGHVYAVPELDDDEIAQYDALSVSDFIDGTNPSDDYGSSSSSSTTTTTNLPSSSINTRSRSTTSDSSSDTIIPHYHPFSPLRILRSTPTLFYLSLAFFLTFLGRAYSRLFFLWIKYRIGWSLVESGEFLAFAGVMTILAQGFALSAMSKAIGEEATMYVGWTLNMIAAIGYAAMPSGHTGAVAIYILVGLTACGLVLLPLLRAIMSREVDARTQGQLGGAAASLVTAANLVGAITYGPLFAYFTKTSSSHNHMVDDQSSGGIDSVLSLPSAPFIFAGAPFVLSAIVQLFVMPTMMKAIKVKNEADEKREERRKTKRKEKKSRGEDEIQYQEEAAAFIK